MNWDMRTKGLGEISSMNSRGGGKDPFIQVVNWDMREKGLGGDLI